jgi:hypothetical protein
MSAAKSIEPGPITGNPPSLEWLAVDMLQIEPAYQRAVTGSKSRRIINGMVREWRWPWCQPLVVTRRSDGSLFVIDGQHRLEGAKARGDIAHLPCNVLPVTTTAAEAQAFVDLNTKRQRLSQVDLFAGMLAAGDSEALAVDAMVRETGWVLARHSNTAHYKAGELACAPMLARQVRQRGEAPVRNALTAMREAWPDTPVRTASQIAKALIAIFDSERACALIDPDALIAALGAYEDPADWIEEGRGMRRANPTMTGAEALAEAITEAAREEARQQQIEEAA